MRKIKRTETPAERDEARYNLLTTQQVADRLSEKRVNAATVRSWIEDPDPERALRAVDARCAGAKRPFYLIEWSWVEDFMARRRVHRAA